MLEFKNKKIDRISAYNAFGIRMCVCACALRGIRPSNLDRVADDQNWKFMHFWGNVFNKRFCGLLPRVTIT